MKNEGKKYEGFIPPRFQQFLLKEEYSALPEEYYGKYWIEEVLRFLADFAPLRDQSARFLWNTYICKFPEGGKEQQMFINAIESSASIIDEIQATCIPMLLIN